jgi:hypothetical protein
LFITISKVSKFQSGQSIAAQRRFSVSMEEGLYASTPRSMKRTLGGSVPGFLTFIGSGLTLPRNWAKTQNF